MSRFRHFGLVCASLTMFTAFPGAARAQLPPSVVAAAKKEGEVILYGALGGAANRPIRELFERTYGIRVTNVRGDAEDISNRMAKGGEVAFDVVGTNDTAMALFEEKGLLDSFNPPTASRFAKQLVPAERGLTPWRTLSFGLNYNTQRLTAAQAPKRWEELAESKWRRKFVMPNPALHPTTLQFLLNLDKLLGPKWLSVVQGWAKQRPRLTRDPGEEIPILTSGEAPLAIGYIKDKFQYAGPIDFVKMDKYLVNVSYIAVARHAAHPNAARLFTDFFVGPEAQQIVANVGDDAVNPDIEDRFKGDVTDEQLVPMRLPTVAEREKWTKRFQEMFK